MRNVIPSIAALGLLSACTLPGLPPSDPERIADEQAALAASPEQAELWRRGAASGAFNGIEKLTTDRPAVASRRIVAVSSKAAPRTQQAFPQSLRTAVVVNMPIQFEEPLRGTARVRSVEGEFVELEIGDQQVLQLQAKFDGTPLRARAGQSAQVFLRTGDIYERNDILAVRVPEDEMIYALVGASNPVRLSLEERGFLAEQTGKPEGNTMQVRVSFRGETRVLSQGQQADFGEAGMTLKVLASVAVQGPAANALEGEPYRIELVAWRSRTQ